MNYVDILLFYQCYNDVYGSYKALEWIIKKGK